MRRRRRKRGGRRESASRVRAGAARPDRKAVAWRPKSARRGDVRSAGGPWADSGAVRRGGVAPAAVYRVYPVSYLESDASPPHCAHSSGRERALAGSLPSAGAAATAHTQAAAGCSHTSLAGATLLRLHRVYMLHEPTCTSNDHRPVGRVYLGICGSKRYALADFDAHYNGLYFGIQDQPERSSSRRRRWQDIGDTAARRAFGAAGVAQGLEDRPLLS